MIIRTRFLLVFLLTAILPLALMSGFIFGSAQHIITDETTNNLGAIANLKSSRTELIVNSYVAQAGLVANRGSLMALMNAYTQSESPANRGRIETFLRSIHDSTQFAKSISVMDMNHVIISSTDPSLIGTIGSTGKNEVEFVQAPNAAPILNIKEPLSQNNKQLGEIEFVTQGTQLDAVTKNYIGLGKTGDVIFIQPKSDGTTAYSISRFVGEDSSQSHLRVQLGAAAITAAIAKHHDASGTVDDPTSPFFFTLHYLSNYNVFLLTKVDTSEAFSGVSQLLDSVLVFGLIFILIIIMIILFFVHSITGPIANLAAVAKKTADGNLRERALVLSGDEIGNLAGSFNHMLDELQESRDDLEQKIHERTQQLEDSNKELESFTYSVSHDLRAPLRAIDGFSKILSEDYSNKLGTDGKHVINTIVGNTHQMARLIDDLLTFSRLGRQEVKTQAVNMTVLVQEVYDEQRTFNPKRKIKFTLHNLPGAHVDRSLMRQVWVNLLSNAIKYTKYKKQAIIEVSAHTQDREIIYSVTDNGAGFDMAYVDKLFGVFQRLHDQQQFDGTGVGLAIIKRVVARHGGKVWAEGKVDSGATFYFSLPQPHKKK